MNLFYLFFIAISCLILSCSNNSDTQNTNTPVSEEQRKTDSLLKDFTYEDPLIQITVSEFCNWYTKAIDNKPGENYNPEYADIPYIIKDTNGYCTLDTTNCFKNLRRYKISEQYIKKIRNEDLKCLENIRKIKYDSLDIVLPEVWDYETIGCMVYEVNYWFQDQGNLYLDRVGKIKIVSEKEYHIALFFREITYPQYMILKKENGKWVITSPVLSFKIK